MRPSTWRGDYLDVVCCYAQETPLGGAGWHYRYWHDVHADVPIHWRGHVLHPRVVPAWGIEKPAHLQAPKQIR
jgi:hypothetical protein